MVERPIKKSERQAKADPIVGGDAPTQASEERARPTRDNSNRDKERGKGRGKRDDRDEAKPPANMALMRGPKPVKPKPEPEPQPEVVEEISADAIAETAPEETPVEA
jgi:hypothetical protein